MSRTFCRNYIAQPRGPAQFDPRIKYFTAPTLRRGFSRGGMELRQNGFYGKRLAECRLNRRYGGRNRRQSLPITLRSENVFRFRLCQSRFRNPTVQNALGQRCNDSANCRSNSSSKHPRSDGIQVQHDTHQTRSSRFRFTRATEGSTLTLSPHDGCLIRDRRSQTPFHHLRRASP